jgi:hypothetical protein
MTYITAVLLFVFGLSPSNEEMNYNVKYPSDYPPELLIIRHPNNMDNVTDTSYSVTQPNK